MTDKGRGKTKHSSGKSATGKSLGYSANEIQNIVESRKNISESKSRIFKNAEEYLKSLDRD